VKPASERGSSHWLAAAVLTAFACSATHQGGPVAPGGGGEAAGEEAKGVPAPAMPGKNVPAIKVNTVGYPSAWKKIVVFNVDPTGAQVKDAAGKLVTTIERGEDRGIDEASRDPTWQVDLSSLGPGTYVIEHGKHRSDPFAVGEGLFEKALVAAQKHFYFQRCRTALTRPHAEWEGDAYTRESACHQHDGIAWDLADHPEKKRRWSPKAGWHDAGNFEMYVPSTAPTAQALLMAYAWKPDLFRDGDLAIPESGNGVPDLLDEVKWGLEWVLSMQEPDGGFRHREAVMEWSENGPADKEKKDRWIAGVGTASTAKGVAVLALAARVYPRHDADFAKRCAAAAQLGWSWLVAHPERVMVDGKGSPQPLWDDGPEFDNVVGARLIAATEVYRTFRLAAALDETRKLMATPQTQPKEMITGAWANLARWGVLRVAFDEKAPDDLRAEAKARILRGAELLREQVEKKDGYRCASRLEDYFWGHNSNLLEKAHVLLMAHQLDPSATWALEAARDQWHWTLGRNPNSYSMVTRIGKGPDRLYHIEWGKAARPVPGYLIDGPNGKEGKFLSPDAPAKALLWDNPKPLRSGLPAHTLWHSEQSDLWDGGFEEENQWDVGWWVVVEPDIYYNGNLVLVAAAMQ
jgi:endoglucanase